MKNKLFVNITGSLISNNDLENFNSVRKYWSFETITITAITELTQGVTMSTMQGSKSDSFKWVKKYYQW